MGCSGCRSRARRISQATSGSGSRCRCCSPVSVRPVGSSAGGLHRGGTACNRKRGTGGRPRARPAVRGRHARAVLVATRQVVLLRRARSAFLSYRVVGGVAIVSGDPIGETAACEALVPRFVEYAHERDWRIAILGASEHWLALYRVHGLHTLYHGDEAVVDTSEFSLEGRAIRKVRQSVHRLEQAGFSARVRDAERDRCRAGIRAGADRRRLARRPARTRLCDVARLALLFGGHGCRVRDRLRRRWRRSGLPALRDCPRDLCALAFVDAPVARNDAERLQRVAHLRNHRLGPVAWIRPRVAQLLALCCAARARRRAVRHTAAAAPRAAAVERALQLDNLLAFNRKFFPRWEQRFLVYERRLDLPRVSLAALAAEAYLPFQR